MAETARLDKWLACARLFKTRALAAAAIDGGKVQLNGARAKRGRPVHVGDRLRVRVGPFEHALVVRGLAARRGSAAVARGLYEETPESRVARERLAEQLRLAPSARYEGKGRPTKRERRKIERWNDGR
jgi:ribosome-associated heat shock protein Hsp15